MTAVAETVHLNWNVQAGGFDPDKAQGLSAYSPDIEQPARAFAVQEYIDNAKARYGVTSATFSDALRWDTFHGGNKGIAKYTGFAAARFVRLEDSRFVAEAKGGENIGVAFATNLPITGEDSTGTGNIYELTAKKNGKDRNRNALGVTLDIGKNGLHMISMYDDDLDEGVRLQHMTDLLGQAPKGVPIVISGDLNTQPDSYRGAPLIHQVASWVPRLLARVPMKVYERAGKAELGTTFKEMDKRLVLPYLRKEGYISADAKRQPTAPTIAPMFTIDHMVHNAFVKINDVEIIVPQESRRKTPSDHLGQVATISIAESMKAI